MLQLLTNAYRKVVAYCKHKVEVYVFNHLVPRSLASEQGYALSKWWFINFLVVTDKKYISDACSYGEYNKNAPDKFDPHARLVFETFPTVLGVRSIANDIGANANTEHNEIKKHTQAKAAVPICMQVYQSMLQHWQADVSINEQICNSSVNVIGKAWFNLPDIDLETSRSIKEAEEYLVMQDELSSEFLAEFKDRLKLINDSILASNHEQIMSQPNYFHSLFRRGIFDENNLPGTNAVFGLVVQGNITTLINCALVHIAANPHLLTTLRQELDSLPDELNESLYYDKIRRLDYLQLLYLESLRFFAPGLPVVRYASKPGTIGDIEVPSRTFIFTPLKSALHDEKVWKNPEQFIPERHLDKKAVNLNKPPFTPFSHGIRMCPAASGFAEAMFKLSMVMVFKDFDLKLTSHHSLETMAVHTKLPRLSEKYYANLVPRLGNAKSYVASSMPSPKHKLRQQGADNLMEELAERTTMKVT